MDTVIIEKYGLRYKVERFDVDGIKTVAQGGYPVEYKYKARQFVVTTVGDQPANYHHVLVFDSLDAMLPFDVLEGAFEFPPDETSGGGVLKLDEQGLDAVGKDKLGKSFLGIKTEPITTEPGKPVAPTEMTPQMDANSLGGHPHDDLAADHAAMTNEGAPPTSEGHN